VVDLALQQQLQTIEASTAGKKAIAFFDLDRTLIAGYSIVAVAWERIQQGVSRGELRQSLKILKEVLQQKKQASEDSYQRMVAQLCKHLEGMSEQTLAELGEKAYHRTIARSLYMESIALVEAHRAAGHHLVILSAASRYQVEPIAKVLGIDEICCTSLEVVDGLFTGRAITPMCYGDGKTMAAKRVSKRLKTSLKSCWFYSDSSHDLPMLEQVGNPVAVNPSDALAVHARANKWPQLHFDSRGLPSTETLVRTMLTMQTLLATTVMSAIGKRFNVNKTTNANRVTQIIGDVGSAIAGIKLDIQGQEHLTRHRPAIFVYNHQSLLDAMVLAHLLRHDFVGFCKEEMGDNLLVGPLLRQVDTIFVSRENQDQKQVVQQALAVIASGRSLVIAPEGTRSTLGDIQPFKHGAFYLAKKAGVPVVPIVLHNVKDALPKGGVLIRPATIQVTILPPIQPANIGSVREAAQQLEDQYASVLGSSKSASLPYSSQPRHTADVTKLAELATGL
jgi:putative phosphoserine phosphatase/1-acylglycerol-3-phosphate O-acyltransferase